MYKENFNFNMPVEIIFGENVLKDNSKKFKQYDNIFVVTGKTSAKKSGALYDLLEIVEKNGSNFMIFDEINENPLLSVCYKGGILASQFGAELIVGIGGGSPVDAAKAIALFAANSHLKPEDLFTPPYTNRSLPIFAIPTTAGTGSEANPYSVITLDNMDKKKTFTHSESYPATTFLDPKYTYSLPYDITVSTALDALCHCIESMFSPKANDFSVMNAVRGIESIYPVLNQLQDKNIQISSDMRRELLFGALCGGIAINVTGTGFPHPMGYNLTLMKGLPHGTACAVFINEYVAMQKIYIEEYGNENQKKLLKKFDFCISGDYGSFYKLIKILAPYDEKFDDPILEFYVAKVNDAKNFSNSIKVLELNKIIDIYKKTIGT